MKATPEQWAQCQEFLANPVVGASDACILELRARVEALEANLLAAQYDADQELEARCAEVASAIEDLWIKWCACDNQGEFMSRTGFECAITDLLETISAK